MAFQVPDTNLFVPAAALFLLDACLFVSLPRVSASGLACLLLLLLALALPPQPPPPLPLLLADVQRLVRGPAPLLQSAALPTPRNGPGHTGCVQTYLVTYSSEAIPLPRLTWLCHALPYCRGPA